MPTRGRPKRASHTAVGLALLGLTVCCFGAAAVAGLRLGSFSPAEALLPPPYPDSRLVSVDRDEIAPHAMRQRREFYTADAPLVVAKYMEGHMPGFDATRMWPCFNNKRVIPGLSGSLRKLGYTPPMSVPFAFVLVCPTGDGGTAIIMESTWPEP
jgi:hypothetical protein